ncbi:DUF4149 domain-containing protein [Hydrogenophaga sp. PAMC20947]|uniref:DUF4149 domain-containing protein n=1 Tax=Hydrogenophaga sp. PAMC20947 TaxID=2565558 RepID=UPI00109E1F2A|nr:DUF4149 domain-containing protein [Hydrogenophaga sp. PAMC20947]QCB45226.1 DUF4149 domain-containing protein [Hydrogenophaga sp. PAMC20947]
MNLQRVSVLVAALWWGALSGMSFLAVPMIFAKLGPALAGPVAAQLFSMQCWMGLGLGLALLLILRKEREVALGALGAAPPTADGLAHMQATVGTMGFVLLAMLLALVQDFGVAQKIVTARAGGGDLRLWHSLGSVMVLGQWLCAGTVLWRLSRPGKP